VFGVIHGKRKDQWLANRLMTERFRQFHFQEFASNLATLVASLADNDARDAYSIDRDKRFDELLDNLKRTRLGEVAAVIAPETRPPIWVHHSGYEEPQWPVGKLSADCLEKLFEAYAKFRFCEQIGYAGDMLRERNRPELEHKSSKTIQWPWYPGMKQPLKVKRTTLQFVWQFSLAFLVLLDSSILAAHLCSAHFADSPLIHVGVVWSALVAVAAKTLSDGLALTREIERYQEYLAVMVELAHAFEKSENEHQKWRIMVETEKASFEEMREFLRSNQEAVFVM
jgi:hypothetical protein